MDMLLDVIRELEADLARTTAPRPEPTDEQRVAALFVVVAKAQHGDAEAKAKLERLREISPVLYEIIVRDWQPRQETGPLIQMNVPQAIASGLRVG